MAHGGKREGAGRKAGSPNKRTIETQAKVQASGLMPLDYMLSVLRDGTADVKDRMDAAKSAAPYLHAKLSSIEHKGGFEVTTRSKEERDAIVAAALQADI